MGNMLVVAPFPVDFFQLFATDAAELNFYKNMSNTQLGDINRGDF